MKIHFTPTYYPDAIFRFGSSKSATIIRELTIYLPLAWAAVQWPVRVLGRFKTGEDAGFSEGRQISVTFNIDVFPLCRRTCSSRGSQRNIRRITGEEKKKRQRGRGGEKKEGEWKQEREREKEREKEKKKKRNEFPRRSNGIKQVAEFHNRRYDNHAQRTGHGVILACGTQPTHRVSVHAISSCATCLS